MVTKMTKYSFILLSGRTEGFLEKIRELGVLDITRSQKPVDEKSSAMLAEADEAKKALNILKSCKDEPESGFSFNGDAVKAVLETSGEIAESEGAAAAALRQMKLRSPWGDFSRENIKKLEEQGLKIRFYSCPKKKFDPQWAEIQALQIISEDESAVRFVTVAPSDSEYSFPIEPVAGPEGPYSEAVEVYDIEQGRLDAARKRLANLKCCKVEILDDYRKKLSSLDLYLAETATEKAAEDYLTVFTGFAPTEDDGRLCREFDSLDVWYTHEPAVKEDNPPVKLKNNWFARNFEVLTGMYGVPAYDEFDPTPVLAPFFMLFFAMCLGDAGYGILLVLIGLYMKFKMQGSSLGRMYRLVIFLGAATMVVGLFLGTFFGISLLSATWTPEWLKSVCVDGWFPDAKIAGFPAQMVLAVGIGVFHICLAMIIKTIGYTRRFGFKNTIATWGWTVLIIGGIIVTVFGMTEILSETAFKWAVIALATVSGLAIYVFNTPGRNPLKNIGAGLWDTYNMVTGLMSDTLSYIRLYALGLAGGMLGNAFNLMGTMVLDIPVPGVNWVFCIIILIFGHILNLAMSCLGAFVHPLRLTFVEYFKNSGYEGTGTKYNPLR